MEQPLKACFKCSLIKPISEFYKHSEMADGHLNKCKDCTKKEVRINRATKRVQYSSYERSRNRTISRRQSKARAERRYRIRHPDKYSARNALNNALRDGRITKLPCKCGSLNVQAHHSDYSRPLEVEWVCFKCHREKFHGQKVVAG